MVDHRDVAVTFARPCASCKGVKGHGRYTYRMGLVVSDVWTCDCGRVVYTWTWSNAPIAPEPKPAPIFEANDPPRAKEQMRLW